MVAAAYDDARVPTTPRRALYGVSTASLRQWARIHLRNERGLPLDWSDRPWLREFWDLDLTEPALTHVVSKKAGQIGVTTWAYAYALYRAAVSGRRVIYTLPTDTDVSEFVADRLDGVVAASDFLREKQAEAGAHMRGKSPPDNQSLKAFGRGRMFLRGTWSERRARSIPADTLFRDEIDVSNPEVLDAYLHRLDATAAAERFVADFSTPTIPGYGIDLMFETTDKREWLVRCGGCAWQGPLDYYDLTNGETEYLLCPDCGAVIDPRNGRWVAAKPSSDSAGFHFTALMLALPNDPTVLRQLHRERREHEENNRGYLFENMRLGMASTKGSITLSADAIRRAALELERYPLAHAAEMGTGPYYMGVDQGDTLTIVVIRCDPLRDYGRARIVWLERVRDAVKGLGAWDHVVALMDRYNVRLTICDAAPNSAPPHELARARTGRVLCCYYSETLRGEVKTSQEIADELSATYTVHGPARRETKTQNPFDVTANRTESLDNTAGALTRGGVMLPDPASAPEVNEFVRHAQNNVRRPVTPKADQDGDRLTYRWDRVGINDYFHAMNYARLARVLAERAAAMRPQASPGFNIAGLNLGR